MFERFDKAKYPLACWLVREMRREKFHHSGVQQGLRNLGPQWFSSFLKPSSSSSHLWNPRSLLFFFPLFFLIQCSRQLPDSTLRPLLNLSSPSLLFFFSSHQNLPFPFLCFLAFCFLFGSLFGSRNLSSNFQISFSKPSVFLVSPFLTLPLPSVLPSLPSLSVIALSIKPSRHPAFFLSPLELLSPFPFQFLSLTR